MTPPAAPRLSCLAFAVGLGLSGLAQADATLQQADQLLNQRQPESAWKLLSPLEDDRGGDPAFDYLLGRAALESGRATEAAFAFERCLAVNPKDGPCRVHMARAHLAMGELSSARSELETIQASEPPAEVQGLVAQYLGALGSRERAEKRRISLWALAGIGHDSNVASATDAGQVAFPVPIGPIPAGTPFALAGDEADQFGKLEAGLRAEFALGPTLSLLADAGLQTRQYLDETAFNNAAGDIGLGLGWRAGHQSLQLKAQAQKYLFDNEDYRDTVGGLAQYQYAPDDNSAYSVYLQHSRIDYRRSGPDAAPNADRNTVGLGYSRALGGGAVIYAGLYAGQERNDDSTAPWLDQDFTGLRAGGSLGLAPRLRLTGALSVEQREFDGENPLFLETREDTQTDLSLGLQWALSPGLSLRPAYTFSQSDSNLVINDFDRHQISIDIRYER